jgi:peptidoglycan/LPS O-acetylase OafA/YrhL
VGEIRIVRFFDFRTPRSGEMIPALTSSRFFAALYVVLFHTAFFFPPSWMAEKAFVRFLSLGFVSVSFFFLLSGYILALVYLGKGKPIGAKKFYIARYARVYPLFALTLLLDTPHLLVHRVAKFGMAKAFATTAATFIANAVMLQAWSLKFQGIDDPNWSLSVETLFYLLFPILGIFLWKISCRSVVPAMILIYAGGQVLILLTVHFVSEALVFVHPLLHLSTFTLGILLARWQTLQRQSDDVGSSHVNLRDVGALIVATSVFFAVCFWSTQGMAVSLHDGLLAPIFALVILVFSDPRGSAARLLSAKWLVVLGEASFGLYLIHLPLLHLFEALGISNAPVVYPVYLSSCIGLSVLSFYGFETPMRRWILKRASKR